MWQMLWINRLQPATAIAIEISSLCLLGHSIAITIITRLPLTSNPILNIQHYRRTPRQCRLHRLVHSALLPILCSQSPADAYSTGSASLTACRSSNAIQPEQIQKRSDSARHDAMGRRAFFRRGTVAAIASSAAATTVAQPALAASSSLPTLGTPAPDFSLISSRGRTVTLDALAADGRWTVLYFYPGAFTSGCTLEARGFQEELSNFRDAGARVVGVSVDSVEKNAEFCTREGLDFFMLTDEVRLILCSPWQLPSPSHMTYHTMSPHLRKKYLREVRYRRHTVPRYPYPASAPSPIDRPTLSIRKRMFGGYSWTLKAAYRSIQPRFWKS